LIVSSKSQIEQIQHSEADQVRDEKNNTTGIFIMRRWILKAGTIGLDGLVLEDAPMPEPGAGEVRIRIHAVSLNYRDQIVLREEFGTRLDRDLVPNSDGAGEIDAIGDGVTTWAVGDRVTGLYFAWLRGIPSSEYTFGLGSLNEDGMLAEYVVLPADRVVRAPASLDYAEAANSSAKS